MIDPDKIFRLMEEFFESGDLSFERMERLHRELEDEFDRQFFNTLKKTVELCHCMEEEEVPQTLHIRVIESICNTPQICDQTAKPEPPFRPKLKPQPRISQKPRAKKKRSSD